MSGEYTKAEVVAALNSASNHMLNLSRADYIKAPKKLRKKWRREAKLIRSFLLVFDRPESRVRWW
jgi:hypothetical protein